MIRKRITDILGLLRGQNWTDELFSLEKARGCVELSALVYEDVQEYELKKTSRIHLFASETYRKFIASGQSNNILNFLIEGDFDAQFFIVRGRYAVVLGVLLNDVLFLAVRGTVFRKLWDWKTNLDTRKFHFTPLYFSAHQSIQDRYFHRGFFESIVPQFDSIADELAKLWNDDRELKITWTGHSLGGAMAAIGNALFERWFYEGAHSRSQYWRHGRFRQGSNYVHEERIIRSRRVHIRDAALLRPRKCLHFAGALSHI